MVYDVQVQSLHRTQNRLVTRWVRNIHATSLAEAGRIACAAHPKLGVTPTAMSAGWYQWPQPKEN